MNLFDAWMTRTQLDTDTKRQTALALSVKGRLLVKSIQLTGESKTRENKSAGRARPIQRETSLASFERNGLLPYLDMLSSYAAQQPITAS